MAVPERTPGGWVPARPTLVAVLVCTAAVLTLCWPILRGDFLAGPHSDQFIAGYGFRLFGAEQFRETGHIPLWNPYLFGGLPFVAAMHGDIFYPTAWLRWIFPTDFAMSLGFVAHIALAGIGMYLLLRALRLGWTAALVGGLAYELTGMTVSMVSPGHDGKLFVTALAPLLFLALLRAIREGRLWGYGMTALMVGLSLHGHPQLSYYLLVAAGLWAAWLVFGDPERPRDRPWYVPVTLGVVAVALGVGLYAIQLLPALEYQPYSPRAELGPSRGWEYATGFSFPPAELPSIILPQFNGILEGYWGQNGIKLHTEYLGGAVLVLAILGVGYGGALRGIKLALGGIAGLFLLVALGGHTPFYRLWYELMPMMKSVRAPGMAFFVVSFVTAIFAGWGIERLLAREVKAGVLLGWCGAVAAFGLLGAAGALQPVAEGLAGERARMFAASNAAALQLGGIRLLGVMLAAGAVLFVAVRGGLTGWQAAVALGAVVAADLWTVDRRFVVFQPPASVTYANDPITSRLRSETMPFRVLDPAGGYEPYGVFTQKKSWLMAYGIPTLLGYHGNEIRFFDELLGEKNLWKNQLSPNLWDLYAVRFLLLGHPQDIPGFHQVIGPVNITPGGSGVLYEADSATRWVRVVAGAVKLPEDQIPPTVVDPRFPVEAVALLPDTSTADVLPLTGQLPTAPATIATLAAWTPGGMTVTLEGRDERTTYLLVGENWYTGWRAEVDGKPARVLRADHALMLVPLPPGAREVRLTFVSPSYVKGRAVSLAALTGTALLLLAGPLARRRQGANV